MSDIIRVVCLIIIVLTTLFLILHSIYIKREMKRLNRDKEIFERLDKTITLLEPMEKKHDLYINHKYMGKYTNEEAEQILRQE